MTKMFTEEEMEAPTQKYMKKIYNLNDLNDNLKPIRSFEVRDDDIFLLGYPKSGTTWIQELVWLIGNDLDFGKAKVFIDERFPNLEACWMKFAHFNPNMKLYECHSNSIEFVRNMKSPRFIKSHLDLSMLPEQLLIGDRSVKIIFVSRNIKDVCVSSYYYVKDLLNAFDAPLEDYAKLFISSRTDDRFKDYWSPLLHFWNRRNDKNILFLRYEEMKHDLKKTIKKVAKFLDKELTEEDETKLSEWLQFDSMKSNSAVNHIRTFNKNGFIRVGKVGEHKKEMSPELIEKFDIWIKRNLKDSDYVNDYEYVK